MRLARSSWSLLSLVTVSTSLSLACSKKSDGASVEATGTPPTASVAPAHASTPPAPSSVVQRADGAAESGPCKLEVSPFVIDKPARAETGVTVVRLPDDRFAVGYATGEGTPRVAVILPEGSANVVDVDASKLSQLSQRPAPKTQRYVHRVTPLVAKDLKVRVAVDFTEVRSDGTRLVRCGPADEDALLSFEGPSAYGATDGSAGAAAIPELRDCRSFTARGTVWALGFFADTSGEVEARWVVKPEGAKLDEEHASIEHKVVPGEPGRTLPRAAQLDRYGYTLLASAPLGDAGYLVASRYNGKLRIAKRGHDWASAGSVTDYWFGTASGMPVLASRDAKVVVMAPLSGKLDLYGAAFPVEGAVPKPENIALLEPPGSEPLPSEAERTAVTAAITSRGQVVAAFLDGKPGKRRARFALLSETLKPQGAAFEPLGIADADVADVKVAMLPDDRVLVTVLVARPAGLSVEGAVLNCGLAPP